MKLKSKTFLFFIPSLLLANSVFSKEFIVTQKDKNFSTENLKVKIGDSIKFVNEEKNIAHNIFSLSKGNNLDLKTQEPGKSSKIVIDAKNHNKGIMELQCAIHPNMKLRVEIE
jgi:plastocyanin